MIVNNPLELDTKSRNTIIDELHKNLFVIAGAGAGKTTILVNRMVAMVEDGMDISKICAITFTVNAAAEFFDRFQVRLKERSVESDDHEAKFPGDLGPSSPEKRRRCIEALKHIDLCFMGTIDSFCNLILSEFPLDAGIPSSASVVEEDEILRVCKEEYKKISDNPTLPIYPKLKVFNELFDNGSDAFSKSIGDILDISYLNIIFNKPTEDFYTKFRNILNKYRNRLLAEVKLLIDPRYVNAKTKGCADALEDIKKLSNSLNNSSIKQPQFARTVEKLASKLKDMRYIDDPDSEFFIFEEMKKGGYKLLEPTEEYKGIIYELKQMTYDYALDFLVEVASSVKESLKKQGKLTFTDYLVCFRDVLLKDMDNGMSIINHIREKYCYFLLDESQDTNPIQTELFLYLSSQCVAKNKASCNPIPGSIFIVGDPKQSIYRFRGADVGCYLNTRDLFENTYPKENNEVVYLTQNFRSTDGICDYFNRTFKNMEDYIPIPVNQNKVDNPTNPTSGVYSCSNYIDVIKTIVHNPNFKITNKKTKQLQEIEYKDIMLITSSTTHHAEIISELKEQHIPVHTEGKYRTKELGIEAIEAVVAIYGYITNIDNVMTSGQLYNLLCSPVFDQKVEDIIGKTKEDFPIEIQDKLDTIEMLVKYKKPMTLFRQIVEHRKLFEAVNPDKLEYVYFLGEKLNEAIKNGEVVDLKDAYKFMNSFMMNFVDRVMDLEHQPNSVYLANTHKVKGLEKPVVILYRAGVSNQDRTPGVHMDFVNNKAIVFATYEQEYNSRKFYTIKTDDYEVERTFEAEEAEKEAYRLKYVAATRAREYLIIEKNSTRRSYWEELLQEVDQVFPCDISNWNESFGSTISYNAPTIAYALEKSYEIKTPSKEKLEMRRLEDDPAVVHSKLDVDSKIKGTIVHRLMEMLVNSNFGYKKDEVIANILYEYVTKDHKIYANILSNVYDRIHNGGYPQDNGRPQDIKELLKNASCYCEVPFSYEENHEVWCGIIDLLFELDGKWYIVDYKTNQDGTGLDKEYEKQLNAYKKAVKTAYGVDAEAYIYHIAD